MNPNFNYPEFEVIEREAGKNSFVLTPKRWIESVRAIGFTATQGRYAAVFAHKDIAFKFASWISAEFELYIIKDYQRLKEDEQQHLSREWNLQRTLSKINYRIHTDAIREQLVPSIVTKEQSSVIYASEADLLNVALFGKTAAQWRAENPDTKGNIRDERATALSLHTRFASLGNIISRHEANHSLVFLKTTGHFRQRKSRKARKQYAVAEPFSSLSHFSFLSHVSAGKPMGSAKRRV